MNDGEYSLKPTIGIVAALPAEINPMLKVVDEVSRVSTQLPKDGDQEDGDREDLAIYYSGTVPSSDIRRMHQVVVTILPAMGNAVASQACANLLHRFPTVQALVMVGTAAGVPNVQHPHKHIRQGDIVVATKGVVEYDYKDGDGRHYAPAGPLVKSARSLEVDESDDSRPWEQWVDLVQSQYPARFDRPSDDTDVVYPSDAAPQMIDHPSRAASGHRPERPKVHQVRIGSGNGSFDDIEIRDTLAVKFGAQAFDMESAGLAWTATDAGRNWIVVRGISDYGDRRRTRAWRPYASLVAAAYTRALLERCPPLPSGPTSARGTKPRAIAVLAVAAVILAGIVTAGLVWINMDSRNRPIAITDQVTLGNTQKLGNGEAATIDIPSPARRRYVDIAVRLENPSPVGDCVNSASIDLEPIVDGQGRPPLTDKRPGDELTVDFDGVQRKAEIIIKVTMPDKMCQVNMTLVKAVLHN